MYLVSIYFDEKTDKRIRQMIRAVAEKSGNTFMLDNNVPPHITVSAFEFRGQEEAVITALDHCFAELSSGMLQWVTVGQFLPGVIYTEPVLNEYLHKLSVRVYDALSEVGSSDGIAVEVSGKSDKCVTEQVKVSKFYKPLQWLPHTTIGKTLSKEQMLEAFKVLQSTFGVFSGAVVKIGLAKTNPYRDIKVWELK